MDRTIQEIEANIEAIQSHISQELVKVQEQLSAQIENVRIEELQRKLADALNPYSSRMGPLVKVAGDKDEISYMVNGSFVPYHEIVAALRIAKHPAMAEFDIS